MRPVGNESFLPLRDEPKETRDGADLAREEVAQEATSGKERA